MLTLQGIAEAHNSLQAVYYCTTDHEQSKPMADTSAGHIAAYFVPMLGTAAVSYSHGWCVGQKSISTAYAGADRRMNRLRALEDQLLD